MSKDESISTIFGRKIRAIRVHQGIAQEDLARIAGIDRSYQGRIERGERNISLPIILKLSKALRIPPSELIKDTIDSFYYDSQEKKKESY